MLIALVLMTLGAIILSTTAAPQGDAGASVLAYSNNIQPEGYDFAFETSNGIKRQEKGVLKNAGKDDEVLNVQGSYSYTGADGKHVKVEYVADENGYQPLLSFGEILAGG